MKIHGLTPQQYRVALLVAQEKTDKEIAAFLYISTAGVRHAIRGIAKRWAISAGNVRVSIANRIHNVRVDAA